jgi:hypothetical protein
MRASLGAGALAAAVFAAGLRWGAMIAGGADSFGYVSQAGLWLNGLPTIQQPIVRSSPWPDAAATWAPLGYRPSPRQRDQLVPIYPPGLPWLMSVFAAVGGYCAAFLVVPLAGALTVWATFSIGRRLFGNDAASLWGALLVATSPTFLYQLMNAMSDVPVTAFCALALWLAVSRRSILSGAAMSVAIAMRPNLAPLAIVIGGWLALTRQNALGFAVGIVPAVFAVLWVNAALYESAFVSGYGTTADLYSVRYVAANVRQFSASMARVEPALAAALIAVVAARRRPAIQIPQGGALLSAWIAVVLLSYLFYEPFAAWWYLRFLLPMWPVLMPAAAALLVAATNGWRNRAVPVTVALLMAAAELLIARDRSVFDLARGERRYVDVARFVASHTEPDAVLLSVQHSGSLRLYADRLTLRFVVLDPLWLDRTVEHLQATGRHPYFVLDGTELSAFRYRFGDANRAGRLDWQPLATLGSTVSIYDPIARNATPPLAIAQTRGRAWPACDRPQSWPPVRRMK